MLTVEGNEEVNHSRMAYSSAIYRRGYAPSFYLTYISHAVCSAAACLRITHNTDDVIVVPNGRAWKYIAFLNDRASLGCCSPPTPLLTRAEATWRQMTRLKKLSAGRLRKRDRGHGRSACGLASEPSRRTPLSDAVEE